MSDEPNAFIAFLAGMATTGIAIALLALSTSADRSTNQKGPAVEATVEKEDVPGTPLIRVKTPEGWVVYSQIEFIGGAAYVPDPDHEWSFDEVEADD